jgi:4-diphosphocytidyl-2-C-methyl-D-erythritol kinase
VTGRAPAKINVCLYLGPARSDGRHELVTVFQPVALFDELRLAPGSEDEVACPGVEGPNLAAAAIAAFRSATGWDGPPVRIEIDKRIPVAAGMAGGSADAAAALRLLAAHSGRGDEATLLRIAAGLGADVPAQVRPERYLATGAGDVLQRAGPAAAYWIVVVPSSQPLATGDVFRQADRMGLPRTAADLADRLAAVRARLPEVPAELAVNDLEPAAIVLQPQIADRLAAVREAGADHALLSGSGPTVLGLVRDRARAEAVLERLTASVPAAVLVATHSP